MSSRSVYEEDAVGSGKIILYHELSSYIVIIKPIYAAPMTSMIQCLMIDGTFGFESFNIRFPLILEIEVCSTSSEANLFKQSCT